MYKNGQRVAYATFNATGADKMSWFNVSRLLTSSWNDIYSADSSHPLIASVTGFDEQTYHHVDQHVTMGHT